MELETGWTAPNKEIPLVDLIKYDTSRVEDMWFFRIREGQGISQRSPYLCPNKWVNGKWKAFSTKKERDKALQKEWDSYFLPTT